MKTLKIFFFYFFYFFLHISHAIKNLFHKTIEMLNINYLQVEVLFDYSLKETEIGNYLKFTVIVISNNLKRTMSDSPLHLINVRI